MALPASGLITAAMINKELGRAENATFSLNDAAVRALAGKSPGAISFADFYGKASEIVARVTTSGAGPDLMKSLFSAADWAANTKKRVIINSGVEISGPWGYGLALTDNASGQAGSFGGSLILQNDGIISGRGGAANGGAGTDALLINFTGRNGQKVEIINNGTLRGGGGGGGKGGNGGAGSVTTTVRDPASGWHLDVGDWWTTMKFCWRIYTDNYPILYYDIFWNGQKVGGGDGGPPEQQTIGGFTYLRGPVYGQEGWSIARTSAGTSSTAGGAGGNGGTGQGYGQGLGAGVNGSGGGTNAGTGGKGGNGGVYGAAGSAGANGGNGNAGGGAAGAAGGAAGCYINGNANVTWSVTGTRQGRVV